MYFIRHMQCHMTQLRSMLDCYDAEITQGAPIACYHLDQSNPCTHELDQEGAASAHTTRAQHTGQQQTQTANYENSSTNRLRAPPNSDCVGCAAAELDNINYAQSVH